MYVMRKFEEAIFYIPFLITASALKLSFRLNCSTCGRHLVFDWTATRIGFCRECLRKDPRLLQGYWVDAYHLDPSEYIRERLSTRIRVPKGFLLDAGCGTGLMFGKISREDLTLVGLDLDRKSICYANHHRNSSRPQFVVGSILYLPFRGDVFDQIIASEVLEHVRDISSALGELVRVAGPRGNLLLTIPNGKGGGREGPGHIHFLCLNEFMGLLQMLPLKILHCWKFGVEFPLVSYFNRGLSMVLGRELPLAFPIGADVPEFLATNFLVEGQKCDATNV